MSKLAELKKHYKDARRPRSIAIIARYRWNPNGWGQTCANVYADGRHVFSIGMDAGASTENMIKHFAVVGLARLGIIDARPEPGGWWPSLWRVAEDNGFRVVFQMCDNARVRDMTRNSYTTDAEGNIIELCFNCGEDKFIL